MTSIDEETIILSQLAQAYRKGAITKEILLRTCNRYGWDCNFIGQDDVLIQKQTLTPKTETKPKQPKKKADSDIVEAGKGLYKFLVHTGKLILKAFQALGNFLLKLGNKKNNNQARNNNYSGIKKSKNNMLDQGLFTQHKEDKPKKNILDEGW